MGNRTRIIGFPLCEWKARQGSKRSCRQGVGGHGLPPIIDSTMLRAGECRTGWTTDGESKNTGANCRRDGGVPRDFGHAYYVRIRADRLHDGDAVGELAAAMHRQSIRGVWLAGWWWWCGLWRSKAIGFLH